jgi:site-specific DNA-methyltransferase (adenine-specific)
MKPELIKVDLIHFKSSKDDQETIDLLADTIGADGSKLLHPITIKKSKTLGNYDLITGVKRLKAFKKLNLTHIPCIVYPQDLTPDQCLSIHFDENLSRYNIPWYDLVKIRAQRHELRKRQHPGYKEKSGPGKPPPKWTLADTAKELGIKFNTLSEDIKLSNAIKSNPSLAKVKDRTTALKLIKITVKQEEAMEDAQLPSVTDFNQILLGDSLEVLKSFEQFTFDACITDPPWIDYKDERLTSDEQTFNVFREVYRVLKPNSFCYIILGTPDFITYSAELPKIGFQCQKHPLIWKKDGTITHGMRAWEYKRDIELILVAVKGSPVLTSPTQNLSAVFDFPSMHHSKMTHPHEKPIELMKRIISHCTYSGSKILDPFAGSGVTLEAANEMDRRYIGIERDETFFKNIEKRLKKDGS